MKEGGIKPKQPINLKRRVEKFLNKNPAAIKKISPMDIRNLFEDLQIYQTELEQYTNQLRKIHKQLQESEEKYRVLFEASGDAIFIAKVYNHELRFENFNNCALEMFGGTNESLIDKTPLAISPPIQPDGTSSEEKAIGKIQAALEGKPQFFEWKHCRLDGTPFDADVILNRLHIGGKDYIQGIVHDITARKKAEEALRDSEEKYSNLFHFSNSGIFVHDLEGKIIDVNQKALDQLGYSKSEILSLKIRDLHPLEALEKLRPAFETVIQEGFVSFEVDFKKKNNEVFSTDVSSSLFEIRGKKVIQSIIRDITERKQAEEEREKLISKLRDALAKVKTLSGMLPICASCKKIRDDKGYWSQIESYIRNHSEAEFSHSICPECTKKIYPDLDIYDDR